VVSLIEYISNTFPETEITEAFGYRFFFYRSERVLPFVTIATQASEYDSASNLSRADVYRLNIGVRKETYRALFGPSSEFDKSRYDFTELDRVMPHPDYAAQSWICVLSPGPQTFTQVQTLIAEAHDLARERFERKETSAA